MREYLAQDAFRAVGFVVVEGFVGFVPLDYPALVHAGVLPPGPGGRGGRAE